MNRLKLLQKVRQWWEAASAIILMSVAVVGIVYGGLHVTGHEVLRRLATPEEVIVFLVSILCGGLGAERLITLKKIGDDIESAQEQRTALVAQADRIVQDVDKLFTKLARLRTEIVKDFKDVERLEDDIMVAVKRINKAEALVGTHEIEGAAKKLLDECDDSEKIKATGQYRVGDGLSSDYFLHVAERVARARNNQGSMEYHVVVHSPDFEGPKEVDDRVKAFADAKVQDRIKLRSAAHPWPFEVLIGGHSMIIALLGGEDKSKYEIAVKITDADFVQKATDWYREIAWEGADRIGPSAPPRSDD